MMRLLDRLVSWWQRRCRHDGAHVAADLLEGQFDDLMIRYCRRCGAVRIWVAGQRVQQPWRLPDPLEYPTTPEPE